jgi:hypothetical protein
VRKSRTAKIVLDTYGNYLGMGRGCLVLKNEKGKEEGRYALAEIARAIFMHWGFSVKFYPTHEI